jgi:nucleotide-binding universal stress UspA family protein
VAKRVVVALDGSPMAEAIVPFLLEIAWPLTLDLVLVRAVVPVPLRTDEGEPDRPDGAARRFDADAYLTRIATDLRARGVQTATEVRDGSPVDEILAVARERGADLIAMTTHGHSGRAGAVVGSVAEAVVRRASMPVFLLRITEAELAKTQVGRSDALAMESKGTETRR